MLGACIEAISKSLRKRRGVEIMEDNSLLERGLPIYLQKDIDALIVGEKNKVSCLDCLYDEVYGSINSAFWGFEITEEQKDYLFDKYLGL